MRLLFRRKRTYIVEEYLKKMCPQSTEAERSRFAISFCSKNPKDRKDQNLCAMLLIEYIEWRNAYQLDEKKQSSSSEKGEEGKINLDKVYWKEATEIAVMREGEKIAKEMKNKNKKKPFITPLIKKVRRRRKDKKDIIKKDSEHGSSSILTDDNNKEEEADPKNEDGGDASDASSNATDDSDPNKPLIPQICFFPQANIATTNNNNDTNDTTTTAVEEENGDTTIKDTLSPIQKQIKETQLKLENSAFKPLSQKELVSKDGKRIFLVIPAIVDKTVASSKLYGLSIALYLDKYFQRTDDETFTVLIDVRAGEGWPNKPINELIHFIRNCVRILNNYHPERIETALIYPVPKVALTLWKIIKPILPESISSKTVLINGDDSWDSKMPKGLEKYLSKDVIHIIEQNRRSHFVKDHYYNYVNDNIKSILKYTKKAVEIEPQDAADDDDDDGPILIMDSNDDDIDDIDMNYIDGDEYKDENFKKYDEEDEDSVARENNKLIMESERKVKEREKNELSDFFQELSSTTNLGGAEK